MMKKGSFYTFKLFSVQDGLDWMEPPGEGRGRGRGREGVVLLGIFYWECAVQFFKP